MADKKITQLDAVTSAANTDLLLIVRDPSTTPVNKKIELGDVFGETAQTVIQTIDLKASSSASLAGETLYLKANNPIYMNNTLDVDSDSIRLRSTQVPATSDNSVVNWPVGTFAWSTDGYLYLAVSSSLIVRFEANTSATW